jgi:cytochrome c oxidase subunit 2
MRFARWTASLGTAAVGLFATSAVAQELVGQPTPDGIGMQPGVTDIQAAQQFFHNGVLMPIISIICLLVLGLLAYVAVKFNKRANPVAARFTHNTSIEVLWTVAPVLVLMFIAIFSFRLLFAYHDAPPADYTIKATGYQWYWGYEYPDQEIGEITSIMLPEDEARAQGRPAQLAVDNPLVVPVNKNVHVLVTGPTSSTPLLCRPSA